MQVLGRAERSLTLQIWDTVVLRIQFLVFEILRNRRGLNDAVYEQVSGGYQHVIDQTFEL